MLHHLALLNSQQIWLLVSLASLAQLCISCFWESPGTYGLFREGTISKEGLKATAIGEDVRKKFLGPPLFSFPPPTLPVWSLMFLYLKIFFTDRALHMCWLWHKQNTCVLEVNNRLSQLSSSLEQKHVGGDACFFTVLIREFLYR